MSRKFRVGGKGNLIEQLEDEDGTWRDIPKPEPNVRCFTVKNVENQTIPLPLQEKAGIWCELLQVPEPSMRCFPVTIIESEPIPPGPPLLISIAPDVTLPERRMIMFNPYPTLVEESEAEEADDELTRLQNKRARGSYVSRAKIRKAMQARIDRIYNQSD